DHLGVRKGIKNLLEEEKELQVIGEASNGHEALEAVEELKPDMLIIDIRMPQMNGLEATQQLSDKSTSTKILILSMHDDEDYILQAIEARASGYLLKDTSKEEFIKAVRTIHQGGKYFSGDGTNVWANGYLKVKDRKVSPGSEGKNYDIMKRENKFLE